MTARVMPGACSSVRIWVRREASRTFSFQICAAAMKKRCSWVKTVDRAGIALPLEGNLERIVGGLHTAQIGHVFRDRQLAVDEEIGQHFDLVVGVDHALVALVEGDFVVGGPPVGIVPWASNCAPCRSNAWVISCPIT